MYEPESQPKNDAKGWGLPFVPPAGSVSLTLA